MKKLKLFLLAFVMVLCGTVVLSACGKDGEPEKPIVAVDSTVNPILFNDYEEQVGTALGEITISTSVGDTPGVIRWQNNSEKIVIGENAYVWVFTPEDTQRYKTATGTLTIYGIQDFELTPVIDNWVYGQTASEPRLMGYTGLAGISIEWKYYDSNKNLLEEKPTEAGKYKLCAEVTIEGVEEVLTFIKVFEIYKAEVETFNLAISDWSFGEDANDPTVSNELKDIIEFYYADSENGTYTKNVPSNAGTYYVKAEIVSDNYSGVSEPVQFEIKKASYENFVNVEMSGWTFGETAKIAVLSSSKLDVNGLTNIARLYAKKGTNNFVTAIPTEAGEYTAKVVIGASVDGNYKETVFIRDFTIEAATFAGSIESLGSVTFDNTSKVPSVIISGYENDDYTLTWKYKEIGADDSTYIDLNTDVNNFVNAGVYKVTAFGSKNYKGGETSAIYTINKATKTEYSNTINVDFGVVISDISLEQGWVWDENHESYDDPLTIGENKRIAIYLNANYNPIGVEVVIVVEAIERIVTDETSLVQALKDNTVKLVTVSEIISLETNVVVTAEKSIVINSGKTLTIKSGITLEIIDGVTFSGTVVNNGTIQLNTTNINNLSSSVNKIVLTENVNKEEETTLTFASDENINCVIDLNDKTLTKVNFVIENTNEMKLTFVDGVINSTTNAVCINANSGWELVFNNVKVYASINALTVEGDGASISATDCEFVSNVNQNVSTGVGALLKGNTCNFINCKFTGRNGLYIKGGYVDLDECVITGNGDIVEEPTTDLIPTGHAIYINVIKDLDLYVDGGTMSIGDDSEIYILEYRLAEKPCITVINVAVENITANNVLVNSDNANLNVTEV